MQCTNLRRLALVVAAGFLFVSNVSAQNEPVHNWAAPLYWQPSVHEAALMKQSAEAQRGSQEQPQSATGPAGATAPLVFVGITPCRMMDTRGYDPTFVSGTVYGPPAMPAGYRVLPVAGVTAGYCTLPSSAQAVSLNVTLSPNAGSPVQYIELWPDLGTFPTVSTMNDLQGQMVNNAAVVALGSDGAFDVLVTNPTNLFIDMNGYYVAPSTLALGAGTVGSPALTFGDTTTGLYSTGAGTLDIATGGTSRATVNSTGLSVAGNLDFSGMITYHGSPFIENYETEGSPYTVSLAIGESAAPGSGGSNTALGSYALYGITSGGSNTAVGTFAGRGISAGFYNVALGEAALSASGAEVARDAAIGASALSQLSEGNFNTALGDGAGANAVSASYNTYIGGSTAAITVGAHASGNSNTFVGYQAGYAITTGGNNTFVGTNSGINATTGSYNIFIANQGTGSSTSPDTESGTIRIGDTNQTQTFISGIYNVTPAISGGLPVVIDSAGQLGTTSSSRRFKTDIADMGDTTDTLMSLRPVQFRYIAHGSGAPLQYGLIAEEVAEVAPELVAHNANGEIETVFYDKVNAMLLNQVQSQQRLIESQKAQVELQKAQLESQKVELQAQKEQYGQLESRLAELESRMK